MALQRAKLGDIAYVPATVGSIYANPASTKTFVRGVVLHNTNNTLETVNVHFVPDAAGSLGSAGLANRILSVLMPSADTLLVEFPYAIVLTDANDSIQASTTTASKVTVVLLGDKDA